MLVMNCFSSFGWSHEELSWSVALEGIAWVSRVRHTDCFTLCHILWLVFHLKSFHCWQAPFSHPSEGLKRHVCVQWESVAPHTHLKILEHTVSWQACLELSEVQFLISLANCDYKYAWALNEYLIHKVTVFNQHHRGNFVKYHLQLQKSGILPPYPPLPSSALPSFSSPYQEPSKPSLLLFPPNPSIVFVLEWSFWIWVLILLVTFHLSKWYFWEPLFYSVKWG